MIKKICPRIITAANNLDRNLKVSVIATTEDKDDKVKDAFYVDLEDAVALIVLIFFVRAVVRCLISISSFLELMLLTLANESVSDFDNTEETSVDDVSKKILSRLIV